jgi:anti-sigma-K factor RskA
MNSHEQIEGDLPLYALGTLDEAACKLVESHLAECPECRRELMELRGDMALLGLSSVGPAPPAHARTRLLAAIAREPRSARNVVTRNITGTIARRAPQWWTLVPAALSLVLLIACLVLWRQNVILRQDVNILISQTNQDHADAERARRVLSVLSAPDAMRVTLVAANTRPQPQGKAIYASRTGGLVFIASNFAPAPPKKAYELWLIPAAGGVPIPAGVFKPDAAGSATVLMPPLPKGTAAKAFAITIEPETGSAAPTPPIVLSGE